MDEEDGRPGPVAATIGHLDALTDALPPPLRLVSPTWDSRKSDSRGRAKRARQEACWGFCPGCCKAPVCRTADNAPFAPSGFYSLSLISLPPHPLQIPPFYRELKQFNISSAF
jgi:hypothetical protein